MSDRLTVYTPLSYFTVLNISADECTVYPITRVLESINFGYFSSGPYETTQGLVTPGDHVMSSRTRTSTGQAWDMRLEIVDTVLIWRHVHSWEHADIAPFAFVNAFDLRLKKTSLSITFLTQTGNISCLCSLDNAKEYNSIK